MFANGQHHKQSMYTWYRPSYIDA